jgi:hypothetical protein
LILRDLQVCYRKTNLAANLVSVHVRRCLCVLMRCHFENATGRCKRLVPALVR